MRIAVARAAYNLAPNILLDDPLAALDPLVGRRVFSDLILSELAGRTRIVVTNHLQYCICPEVCMHPRFVVYVYVYIYIYMYIYVYIYVYIYIYARVSAD
jgi:ABC-type arginine transport system ATPase subunit